MALAGLSMTALLSSPAGAQGLITEKNISLAMAQTIANAALEQCQRMGYQVSVTVVDRAGLPIVMLRGDGASLHTPEGSDRKAYTARTFRAPSAACWRWAAGCRSRSATMWSAPSASLAPLEKTTFAHRPGLTRWPINSNRALHP
jgi:uncharacterized protein GlcG (DUF336 family)